jgi:hypothetical protein
MSFLPKSLTFLPKTLTFRAKTMTFLPKTMGFASETIGFPKFKNPPSIGPSGVAGKTDFRVFL